MRVLGIVLILVLAGCVQPAPDPLADRGELPEDIAAPPPGDVPGDAPEFVDPPGRTSTVAGTVTDASGTPLGGIVVWVEATDLRQAVDNVALYEQIRDATWTITDGAGRFEFSLEGGLYSIIANGPGWLPRRSATLELVEEPQSIELVLVKDSVRIVAHRGASFYAPENTLPALRKAHWLGAHAVELDVRLTGDGQAVMFHDPLLDRTTNAQGPVDLISWQGMARLDAGKWFDASFEGTPVPTLRQALESARAFDLEVFLDIKATAERAPATRAEVAAQIKATGMQEKAVMSAFRKATVTYCVDQGLRCAYISNGTVDGPGSLEIARGLGAHFLLLNQTSVTAGLADKAAGYGIQLYAWTANDLADWERLWGLGVHGILTDRPAFLADFMADQAP